MTLTTPRGYPYPTPTDAVSISGDFQKLATAIDADVNQLQNWANAINTAKVSKGGDRMHGGLDIQVPAGWWNQTLTVWSGDHAPHIAWWDTNNGVSQRGLYIQTDWPVPGAAAMMTEQDRNLLFGINGEWRMEIRRGTDPQLVVQGKIAIFHSPRDTNWYNANLLHDNGSFGCRLALHHPGSAPELVNLSNRIEVQNGSGNGHVNFVCYQLEQVSSAAMKKDIRPLRADFTPTATALDPESDTVSVLPDIMALRPVVYRHAIDPTYITVDETPEMYPLAPLPDGTINEAPLAPSITADKVTETPWPDDRIGREFRREQLGLIAEEVEAVIPSAVTHNLDGTARGIVYSEITIALLDHVQRLTERVAALEGA